MAAKIVTTLEPRKTVPATLLGTGIGVIAGSLVAASVSALAAYFARRVVTPELNYTGRDIIRDIVTDADGETWVHFARDTETAAAGAHSLFTHSGQCCVRLSGPEPVAGKPRLVARKVLHTYYGTLEGARRGNLSGSLYEHPSDIGITAEEVDIELEVGPAPAWLVRGQSHPDVWVICVHGRGARRTESIRALPTFEKLGVSALLMSYRNDGLAPNAGDGRYGLGDTEWHDVESGISYAQAQGAKQIVLLGWSMGGAISLQAANRSFLADQIDSIMLVGPVINWVDVLSHQARLNRIPQTVGLFAQWLLSNRAGRWITGLAAPVNLKRLNWVERAAELQHQILIIHSRDDEFVPIGPSERLARLRPDLVTLRTFSGAGHTREPNVDPDGFDEAISQFLAGRLADHSRP
ncbi:alpha/beta hydrolase [Glutamicibacter sp. MNS18]|uniref:alpha/beta hydrolase family protein n=1 Tax=Glutamicibacter sp. MNS18 TaxID=2989817 RepID=UPI0022369412|nr:alpha/beta hydrolase [Glutamicibacter sp. MNS18]MCW4464503.1 alpha/beta hydrolase [Glutamicibacter sp. MNS18]